MATNLAEAMSPSGEDAGPDDPALDQGFQRVVQALVRRARSYMQTDILPDLDRARRYARGEVDFEPAGDTGERRHDGSQIYEGSALVMTEVRDTIDQLLPELARVFLGTDRAVEFTARNEEDAEGAEQASDHANWVFKTQNEGDDLVLDLGIDWLVKYGAVKVWWESEERREVGRHVLPASALSLLVQEVQSGLGDIVSIDAQPMDPAETVYAPTPSPDGGVMWIAQANPDLAYEAEITRVVRDGSIRIEAIPPDELLIDGDSKSPERARLVGHEGWRLAGDLVALGLSMEEIRPHLSKGGPPLRRRYDPDRAVGRGRGRNDLVGGRLSVPGPGTGDESLDWVQVFEGTVQVDRDEDGVPERYRVLALGDRVDLRRAYEDDSVGFVVSSPYRVPHRPIGEGVPERTDDLQDSSTVIFRLMLDNLARSIHGVRETISTDNPTAYNDLRSYFPGKPIRLDRADQLGFHVVPFVAGNAFPFFDFMQQRAAARTGISAAGSGLDPDALKGQTLEGGHAIISAPQSRTEYLVREFAVSMVRPIFKEIHRLAVKYQDRPTTIRLRNKWVTVDPRTWNASMDCEPRVGLGTGSRAERFLALQLIAAKQEQLMATQSPLVTITEYRNTLVAMAELAGEKQVGRYFKDVDDEQLQQMAAQAAQQQQEAQQQAQQAVIQVEAAKAQARAQGQVQAAQATASIRGQADAQKAQLGAQADAAKDQRKASLDVRVAQLKADTDLERTGSDASVKLRVEQLKAAADREQTLLEAGFKERLALMEYRLKQMELAEETRLEEKKIAARSRSGDGNVRQVTDG